MRARTGVCAPNLARRIPANNGSSLGQQAAATRGSANALRERAFAACIYGATIESIDHSQVRRLVVDESPHRVEAPPATELKRVGRLTALVVLAAALLAGCGGSSSSSSGTLDALMKRAGPDVPLIMGAADFQPGVVRLPFLLRWPNAQPVHRPTARVWLATGRGRKPFAHATARLEAIGVHGRSATTAITRIYVAHLPIPRAGRYWLVAEPTGARIQASGSIDVPARSSSLTVGARAPRSDTPTLATPESDIGELTTRRPPDLALLRYSVAASLDAHRPFVLTFASSQFCASPTCAPVVDVVDAVRRRFASSDVRFIHVEVFRDNDPHKGYNRWMRQWALPSEPWTFLVGRDGRVKAKFEGAVSVAELVAAVRQTLL